MEITFAAGFLKRNGVEELKRSTEKRVQHQPMTHSYSEVPKK